MVGASIGEFLSARQALIPVEKLRAFRVRIGHVLRISHMRFFRWSFLLGFALVLSAQAELRLSEVMTCNTSTYQDPSGEFPDWIELHVAGKESIDLAEYRLGSGDETAWQFPRLVVEPGTRLVLFASGRDRWHPGDYHVPFRLSADGESLRLVGPGEQEQWVDIPRLPADVGYGVAERSLLAQPTPGEENAEPEGFPPLKPTFSRERGFVSSPFLLTMTAPVSQATILYTVDGSAPNSANGEYYQEPFEIIQTTVVRAVCLLPDCFPSRVTTASYLFPQDILTPYQDIPEGWPRARRINGQHLVYGMEAPMNIGATHDELAKALVSVPAVSLVMKLDDLLGRDAGIYTHALERGRAWERSVSMEWIDPRDGSSSSKQADAGLRIRGGYSRHHRAPKHGFRVLARMAYGEDSFDWPCFGPSGPNRCRTVDLRSPQNHSWSTDGSVDNTFLRDGFCRDTQRDLGQPYTRGQFVNLFLNGVYWGVYESHERVDADYAEHYLGADPDTVDVIKAAHPGVLKTITAAREGGLDAWRHLWESANRLAAQRDEGRRLALYHELQGLAPDGSPDPNNPSYVDVPNLIDYMMIIFFSANQDAPISQFFDNLRPNNWFAVRDRDGMEGFRFFIHDSEHSLGLPKYYGNTRIGPFEGGADFTYSNPQWLHQQLMSVGAYRKVFGDRAESLLGPGGLLSSEANIERLGGRERVLRPVMALHAARWGSARSERPRTKRDWRGAVARLKTYLMERPAIVKNQFRGAKRFALGDPSQHYEMAPLYPWVEPPRLWRSFTDPLDVRITADEGDVSYSTSGRTENIALLGQRRDDVLFDENTAYRMAQGVEVEDWMRPGFDAAEWKTELSQEPLSYADSNANKEVFVRAFFDLVSLDSLVALNLQFTFEDGYDVYLNGRLLARHEPLVTRLRDERAVPEMLDLREFYSHLRKGANLLAFAIHRKSRVSSDIEFAPRLEATFVTGGKRLSVPPGETIEARSKLGRQWSALAVYRSTGKAERASAANLVISEIMYHPPALSTKEKQRGVKDPDSFEFLEFLNTGSKPINLSKVRFIDGIQFQFPDRGAPLGPGQRLVVAKDPRAFAVRYPKVKGVLGPYAGGLKNGGERLTILDSRSQPILRFRYDDDAPWPSSADGLGFSLVLSSASGKANLGKASSWRASTEVHGSPGRAEPDSSFAGIVINEVLTNSDWPDTDAIELHNPSDRAVDVSGWFLTDDVKEPKKWPIPTGTVIPAKGYWVVQEDNDADLTNNADLGPNYFGSAFSLSSLGEEVFLFSADAKGTLTGYTHGCEFDALPTGIAYGRSINSAGKDVFAIRKPTLGNANGMPLLGPVLFTEVHYHPEESDTEEVTEFVEIWNRTDHPIPLFDPKRPENTWALKGAKFTFPPDQTLAPGETALVARMEPQEFRRIRGLSADVKVYGPFEGNLNNSGERLTLERPLAPEADGELLVIPMVPVDSIRYNDKAPWPQEADGAGQSLERRDSSGITDEPNTWQASVTAGGSPGTTFLTFKPTTNDKQDDDEL